MARDVAFKPGPGASEATLAEFAEFEERELKLREKE